MNLKYIKPSIFLFIISYIFVIVIFSFISHKFIISDALKLEENQNQNNVHTILNSIDANIKNITNIISDYSKWDDSYNFMITLNEDYIYENFREGTKTLQDLNVDFIIYENKAQKILFSKYENDILKKDNKVFEIYISNKFEKIEAVSTIIKYKSYYMYLIKSAILKSDETGEINGWIYSGKIITSKALNQISKAFKTVKINNTSSEKYTSKMSLQYLKNVQIKTNLTSQGLINNIQIYDDENNYILSIITENERLIINNAEKTIFTLNFIVSIFLFIICYIVYRNQIMLSQYNELLERKVDKRTDQLTKTLRKLKTKNKELYTLANIDSLTKIKNRRSFFIESEALLSQSILEDNNFCILMIDIDHFKKVNDTYGHSVGDKVLIEFCTIISSIISDEIFGRIGGEEFCISFFNKNINEINNIAESIRSKCEETIVTIDNNEVNFTISLGLSCRANFTKIDEILQVSDELLYKAKDSGRNRLIRCTRLPE
ncbi:diguanylate cyclase [Sulfurimonas sp.]|uniref:sensor domain-containing diguanylate cyclase n=1 Tax=Sulfurimonas sp. TaxID=2022749 RepID=UPI003564F327